ncbi:MAG: AMP-binding protein [Rhizobiales bacterium]|nr:AMP-binding protein [Hyphomicrobiales bacterium]
MAGNVLFDGLTRGFQSDRLFARLPDGRHYSYQDVLDVSARFANVLVERGVQPGDRVAVQAPKSIEALMLYLGAVRAGAVFLPLNNAYTPAEIDYFLSDAEPAVFVCDPAHHERMAPLAASRGIRLETLGVWRSEAESAGTLADAGLAAPTTFETKPRAPGDIAALLYTSGTTGRSKGAMLTHDNLLSNSRTLQQHWRFTANDVLLHALPIFHTHGLFVATNVTLLAGGALNFLHSFDIDCVLGALPTSTAMMGVPTFYTRLLDEPRFTRELVAHMRLFVSGSAPLLAETHARFEARTGHRILERYGMTETSMNASNPYDGERRPGSVGFPLPGVSIRIADPQTGEVLAPGAVGVIEVAGPNVFAGYWRNPEKTAEEFRPDGYFITGDVGVVDGDGYLSIVGRAKDLIISGGFNVYPKEVEAAIDDIEGVAESAVVGVPHPDFGEAVVAVVVPKAGAAVTPQAVMAGISGRLARFKQPKHVVIRPALPRNAMGKVTKKDLRDEFADHFIGRPAGSDRARA